MRRSRALLVAPLSVLTLAACGGSGPLTQSQFVSEANNICKSSSQASVAVPQPSVSSSLISPAQGDLPAIAAFLGKQVGILQNTVSQLKQLGTPPSMRSAWSQALAAIQKSVDDATSAQSAAHAGDIAGYTTALGRVVEDGPAIDQSVTSFGATACSSSAAGGSPSPSPAH
ncbi:MAG: hypothetical protein JOZ75_00055 [Candidatus Dormibacteraeota bacterium]|nr:hypothetical protein [Candidatus Dormibacteraeota bacterium]